MKRITLRIISVFMAVAAIFTMSSCTGKSEEPATSATKEHTKAQISQAVKIANVPTEKAEIIKMLNSALDYVDVYCYAYTKSVKCSVSDINVGTLSAASNSNDAFASIFGETEITSKFDYKVSKDDFGNNFIKSGFTAEEATDAQAQQDGDMIVLTVSFKSETNPQDGTGILYRLGGNYQNVDAVKKNLTDFNSSAKSINISATDISITAKVSADDSSLKQLDIKYTEKYALSGVTLVKLEGTSVTGNAATVISYTEIG